MTARDLVFRYALFALLATGANAVLAGLAEELEVGIAGLLILC